MRRPDENLDLYKILMLDFGMKMLLNEFKSCVELFQLSIKKLMNSYINLNEVYTDLSLYLSVRNILNNKIRNLI